MVDAVISFAVERVGDFLCNYLKQEAGVSEEVKKKAKWLEGELPWMQCFIKNAEEKPSDNRMIRKWVSDVRDIAFEIEDVLDEFLLQVENERSSKKRWLNSTVKRSGSLKSIDKKIESLENKIRDLSDRPERYGLQAIDNKNDTENKAVKKLKQLRRTASFALEEHVVGFKDDFEKLKNYPCWKLYRHKDVKNKFSGSAWVSVSQDYEIADLLLTIIKSFNINSDAVLEKMREEDMERLLHNYLQERSYLVVLDDVWQKDAWKILKRAFPDNEMRSRVIITTRKKEVAERSDERTYVHNLRFLRLDESWELFCHKASRNMKVDDGLEELGREMVKKCGGLPLAIVVLGGLLFTKKAHEWQVVRDHIWRQLRNGSIEIKNLFALSFNDLSYHLKLCFLYLGLYPEDSEIDVEKLIRLLVAEDLIEPPGDVNTTMEDAAQDVLVQLIDRSLIQVGRRQWGKIKTLRVHDVLRDLAIRKGRELRFIDVQHQTKNSTSSSSESKCRRQAVYSTMGDLLVQHLSPFSRSVLLLNQWFDQSQKGQKLTSLCKELKLLRVLDIEHGDIASATQISLPEEIGRLIHLRYLGLQNLYINSVASSIPTNLQRLQTLDLLSDKRWGVELPTEICTLQELRHLIGDFRKPLQIDNLTNLQTLKYVSLTTWASIKTDKLGNLRKLHIRYCEGDDRGENFTFNSISKLENLQLLSVELERGFSFGSLQPLSNCPNLVDLKLKGKINELPENIREVLPNLERLSLQHSRLEDDPMPKLQRLSSLVILELHDFYVGAKMVCTDKGFSRLEILSIDPLSPANELQVEEGAMPVLKYLTVPKTFGFKIPQRLMSIPPPASEELDGSYWA